MPASALAAVSAFEMIFFREDNIAFGRKVIFIGFKFVKPAHSEGKVIFLLRKMNELVLPDGIEEGAFAKAGR
jgi:hypothetical protein